MRFKDFIKESIIDIPRRTYAPGVFDNADTKEPKIKSEIIGMIMKQFTEFKKEYPILDYSLIGSILTKRYRDDADLDINVLFDVPKEKQEEERIRLSKKFLSSKNPDNVQGKLIPGTKHPINYYIITDKKTYDDQNKKADAVFDIGKNKFIKRPDDFTFDVNLYVKEFERKVQELDVIKGELKRDIIDYEELKGLTPNDVLDIQDRVNSKLEEIEDDIQQIIKIGDNVEVERRAAFDTDMSPDEIRQYGIKNRLPKNVIYKMLEKYHYLKFYKKCKQILDDGKVTDAEIDSLKVESVALDKIKLTTTRWFKDVVDKIKRKATTSQRYEYAAKVLQDVIDRKEVERARMGLPLRHDIGYYAAAVADTFHDIDPKKLVKMVREEYLPEAKSVAFTFGRFNPPTTGHEKLISKVKSVPTNDYKIYLSRSEDPKKNPLSARQKLDYMKKMFPQHARNIEINTSNMVLDIATNLYKKGYTEITMVVGSDRVREFETILKKYNDIKSRHGYYNFDKINVVSAGERDPDAEGVSGMSASKMRDAAQKGDVKSFSQGLPRGFRDVEKLFKDVRRGMNLAANYTYVGDHRPIASLQEFEQQQIRDLYVREMIFNIDDKVNYIRENIDGKVVRRGTNYIVVEDNNNNLHKAWIWDCLPDPADREAQVREYNLDIDYGFEAVSEKKEYGHTDRLPQDKDISKEKGSQPKKYFKQLSKDTKSARAKHFSKTDTTKNDNDPAPGDKDAKTKPSVHTQKYKKMFGELKKELSDACWTGYKQVGMKNKGGKQVPNCVPEETIEEKKVKISKDGKERLIWDAELRTYLQMGWKVVKESYDIGHDYAQHTLKTTPGQDGYDPNYQGGSYKPSVDGTSGEQVVTRPMTTDISVKDINDWAASSETIDKYRERYKEEWKAKLSEVVSKMIRNL
jgi:predicted nucleotidyltransferase